MKRMVRLFQVYHPEGADAGLRPPKFTSRRLAETAARKWNRDFPGHVVQEVTPNKALSPNTTEAQ